MKNLRNESGQVTILTALCMTVLLGFLAFAADVGTLLRAKRVIQSAADCAAMAGAAEINYYGIDGTTIAAIARKAAAANGFTNGSGGVTVTVNAQTAPATATTAATGGPVYGPYAGNPAYVEVIIAQNEPTFFMKLFNQTSMAVSARAVAGLGSINTNCFNSQDPSASPAVSLTGSFNVDAPNCGVTINSNSPNALSFTGAAGTLTAGSVQVVGGDSGQSGDSTPAPVTGVAPVSNPLGYMTPPPTPTVCPAGGTLTGTISPGCYSGAVTLSNVTLNAGLYIFTGNVTLDGTVNSAAGGTTLDLVSGGLTENTGTVLGLIGPTNGTYVYPTNYPHVVFLAPITNTSTLAFAIGDATGTITGEIDAPGMQMTMQDHGGSGKKGGLILTSDLIVGTFVDTAALLNLTSFSESNPTTTPLTIPTLVE